MSNSLRGKRISDSYQSLVQVIEGQFFDGSGNPITISTGGSGEGSGFQGPQGFRGLQGFHGGTGPQGQQGPVGPVGLTGSTGAGVTGPKGAQGAPGPPGAATGSGDRPTPRTEVSTGGTCSWDPLYHLLVVDPSSTINGLNIVLPDTTDFTGGELYWLSFGGIMESGTVVNSLTIRAYPGLSGPGSGILSSSFQGTYQVGDGFIFAWDSLTQKWRLF